MTPPEAKDVLIVSPNTADADYAITFLREASVGAKACYTLGEISSLIKEDYGCLVLVEESLSASELDEFKKALAEQPPWSDVPIILIAAPESPLHGLVESLFPSAGNVALLQRPLHPISFVSAVRVALRARQRQIEVRNLLRQRETSLRKRDEFLAMLSHELRNPLAPLRNASYILGQCGIQDPKAIQAMRLIDNQVTHLSRLVGDLLDVSRLENGKVELRVGSLDLNGAIASAVDACLAMTQAANQTLSLRLSAHPLYVCADPVRLEQIFINLISNASKFTQGGGTIVVETASEAERAHARIQDNGAGIATEKLGTIFELFEQANVSLARSAGGLGIGLTVVKKLVELHGGTIHAESEGLGKGSTFVAEFPIDKESISTIEPKPATGNAGHLPKRVLVVDDNADIRTSLIMLISMWGHEAEEAATGPEAVNSALVYQPDIALIDIGLPGLDGFEVARRIRQSQQTWVKNATLVALTGYGQPSDRERALEAGFNLHLVKPVDITALKTLLDN